MTIVRVYLCGGINGLNDEQCKTWREKAKELAPDFIWLDPMRYDYRGRAEKHTAEIVRYDYTDIANSDAILANVCRPSWGTAMEIHQSYAWHKPVIGFGVQPPYSPWLLHHTSKLVMELEEAIDVLRALSSDNPCS